jgi:SAM-dependent methyltransferase
MVSFVCNICGEFNEVEHFVTEPATCRCGSNVRVRALIHLLSMEMFGESLPLIDFPRLKSVRGLGMSDKEGYAAILAEKFDYTNTFYDCDPRMDFTEAHPQLHETYDFILSADVIEHIAPPIECALEETCRMLRPNGFFGVTVYCGPSDVLREHFPDLHTYRTVSLGDDMVLINRRADGGLEIRDGLVFHGGSGATLEMREFGISSLREKLLGTGFRDVHLLSEDLPRIGVLFDKDVSQPLIARKQPFSLSKTAVRELLHEAIACREQVQTLEEQAALLRDEAALLRTRMKMASDSRWVKLGRKFGVGPTFE